VNKSQSRPFDPDKDIPTITETEAKKLEAALLDGSAIRALTPEQLAADEIGRRQFEEENIRQKANADRIEIVERIEKRKKEEERARRESEREDRRKKGLETHASFMAKNREKRLQELSDCVSDIFRSLTKLNSGLKQFSAEDIESLPMLKPGLESLLKKI